MWILAEPSNIVCFAPKAFALSIYFELLIFSNHNEKLFAKMLIHVVKFEITTKNCYRGFGK